MLSSLKNLLSKKPNVHFLHIGKTGGSAFRAAVRNVQAEHYTIHLHPHKFTLIDVPPGEKVIFILRDPIKRFVSGFYSRQRQGLPRYFAKWSPEEEKAFRHFTTANELAEAISSKDKHIKEAAIAAMRSIKHVKSSYWRWFKDQDYFTSRLNDILYVARTEELNTEFENLKQILGLPDTSELPTSDEARHKNPDDVDKTLSKKAIENLEEWYKQDYNFLNYVEKTIRTNQNS